MTLIALFRTYILVTEEATSHTDVFFIDLRDSFALFSIDPFALVNSSEMYTLEVTDALQIGWCRDVVAVGELGYEQDL